MKSGRLRCSCGTPLASDNRDGVCGPCARLKAQAEWDIRCQQVLKAREVVGTLHDYAKYQNARSYFAALSVSLDGMCTALGLPPLDVQEVPW